MHTQAHTSTDFRRLAGGEIFSVLPVSQAAVFLHARTTLRAGNYREDRRACARADRMRREKHHQQVDYLGWMHMTSYASGWKRCKIGIDAVLLKISSCRLAVRPLNYTDKGFQETIIFACFALQSILK